MSSSQADANLSIGKRVLFSLITVVVAVLLFELAVLVIFRPVTPGDEEVAALEDVDSLSVAPGRERAGLGFRDPSMTLHPYLGYVFLPKDRRSPDNPGHPAIAISDDGFLDKNPAVRKRANDRVIVGLTGGSVSGQLGTWHPHHLADALQTLDEFRDKELEFVWLGMPGYHQPQQAIQLIYILAQGGEFDYVINLDGFNEVAVPAVLNAPLGAHPLFPMNWSMVALDVPDVELRRAIGAMDFLRSERRERNAAFAQSPWRRSPTAKLMRQRDDEKLARRLAGYVAQFQSFAPDSVPYFVSGPDRMHGEMDEMVPELVNVWTQSSLQMHAICTAYGIRYLHCLQPNQYVPGSKPLSGEEEEKAYDPNGPYRPAVEMGYPQLQAAGESLKQAGVAFYDLTDVFETTSATLYTDVCCHFNGEGNRIMSLAIAAAIEESFGVQ